MTESSLNIISPCPSISPQNLSQQSWKLYRKFRFSLSFNGKASSPCDKIVCIFAGKAATSMLDEAKNEWGIKRASATIIFLPIAFLFFCNAYSSILDLIIFIANSIFAALALTAFLCEKAEEDEREEKHH